MSLSAQELVDWCMRTKTTLHIQPNGYITLQSPPQKEGTYPTTSNYVGCVEDAVKAHSRKVLA